RVAVAGAVGILVVLVAVVLLTPWRHGPAGRAPVAIALVEVGETYDRDTRWPGALLHAWLEVKLESTPEVTLLDESHLAAVASALAEVCATCGRDTRWRGAVLPAWLAFELESTPEGTLPDESHLAGDAGALTPTVVLLATGTAAGQPDLHFVRARIEGTEGP